MTRPISLLTVLPLFGAAAVTLGIAGSFPLYAGKRSEVERVQLNGYAEWWRDGSLVVDGERVRPDSGMKFSGRGGVRTFDAIPLGYEVAVEGTRASDGTVLARRVEAKPNGTAFLENDVNRSFDEIEQEWRRQGSITEDPENPDSRLGRLIESGPDVERVAGLARRLLPPYVDPERYRFYVVDNEEWNAMAGPNGSVFVFRGLLRDLDDDEVAIVIGHELVHATYEHSRRAFKKSFFIDLIANGGLEMIDQAVDGGVKRQLASLGAMLGAMAWANRYSREQEDQADRVGLRYAYEGGFDVAKAPMLWRKFAQKYGDTNRLLGFFFADHSSSADRARKLEREIAMNYAGSASLAAIPAADYDRAKRHR